MGCDDEDAMTWGVDIMVEKIGRLRRDVVSQSEEVWKRLEGKRGQCLAGMEADSSNKACTADFGLLMHVIMSFLFCISILRPIQMAGVEKYGKSEGIFEGDGIVAPCH